MKRIKRIAWIFILAAGLAFTTQSCATTGSCQALKVGNHR